MKKIKKNLLLSFLFLFFNLAYGEISEQPKSPRPLTPQEIQEHPDVLLKRLAITGEKIDEDSLAEYIRLHQEKGNIAKVEPIAELSQNQKESNSVEKKASTEVENSNKK